MGTQEQGPNGWTQYQRLVLDRLDTARTDIAAIRTQLGTIEREIAMLKVKSGAWGLVGGLIPVLIALTLQYINQHQAASHASAPYAVERRE